LIIFPVIVQTMITAQVLSGDLRLFW